MNSIDKQLKNMAKEEAMEPSAAIQAFIQRTLSGLPDDGSPLPRKMARSKRHSFPRPLAAIAAAFALFLLIPNLSASAAEAMSDLPLIGPIVDVITIRNYFYDDGYHRSSIDVPQVELGGEGENSSLGDSVQSINADVQAMTDRLIAQFEADTAEIGDSGHTELSLTYQVLTNTDSWFTLEILVYQGAGSGSQSYHYYHIDKRTGQIMQLSDLFTEGNDYQTAISDEILRQMNDQMAADESITYWVGSAYPELDFHSITPDQNFYFSENGNLVIRFDEYEVGPGSMGSPAFEIPRSVYESMLKEGY